MLFYHFTSPENLPGIMKEGLCWGKILDGEIEGTAINLTTDPHPESLLTLDKDTKELDPVHTSPPPADADEAARDAWLKHNRNVRITLKLHTSDPKLFRFYSHLSGMITVQAGKTVGPTDQVVREAILAKGMGDLPSKWWLYFTVIPPKRFVAVETRVDGDWVPVLVTRTGDEYVVTLGGPSP